MASDKIDMSLDDIIKLNKGARGGRGGRGGRGTRGSFRGRRGTVSRGAASFSVRGRGARKPGGVLRGGIQKRRGFRQTPIGRGQLKAAYQQGGFTENTNYQQQPRNIGAGDASSRLGKLMISNLDFGVNDADIKELFAEFGVLRKAAVHYDRTGRSLGTAEVTYAQRQDAVRAMKQYNNVPLDGRPMNIQLLGAPGAVQVSPSVGRIQRGGLRGRGAGGRGAGGRGGRGAAAGRGAGGRGTGRGGFAGRGRGRGRGAKTLTKDELDAQLDAYKMDTN